MTKQEAWAKYYEENKEHLKARSREHYHANKDKKTEESKAKKRKYLNDYYRRNKEAWKERAKRLRVQRNAAKRKKYRENEAVRNYCKNNAKQWKVNNPSKSLAQDLAVYGLSLEGYQALLEEQDFKCAICGKEPSKGKRRLGVDHCHSTNTVRGLLCSPCNFAIGIFKDDPKLLMKAVRYLRPRREA